MVENVVTCFFGGTRCSVSVSFILCFVRLYYFVVYCATGYFLVIGTLQVPYYYIDFLQIFSVVSHSDAQMAEISPEISHKLV